MKTIKTILSAIFICLVLVAGVNALTLTSAEGVWTDTSGGSQSPTYAVQISESSGVEYTFEVLGFGDTADDLISSFTSYEEMTNDTELWGDSTAVNPVPEPTTMLLFGFGLLGMANVARRKLG
jgi:hypothetical protein